MKVFSVNEIMNLGQEDELCLADVDKLLRKGLLIHLGNGRYSWRN